MRIATALASGLLLAVTLLGGGAAGADPAAAASAPGDWTLRKQLDGIVVHTRPVADSALLAFRGAARVKASLRRVVALIADGSRAGEWVDRTRESRPLAGDGPDEGWIYTRTDLPWPVTDRDGITHWRLHQDEAGVVTIDMTAVPDFAPRRADCVRIPSATGRWRVTAVDHESADVVFEHHNDPGGRIPGWLANSVIVEIPLNTLRNLRRALANEPEPVDLAGFDFLRDPSPVHP